MAVLTSVASHFPTPKEGFITTTASTVDSSSATTVPLNSVSGLTNGNVFVGIIDPGNAKQRAFTGIVDTSGVQITSVVWTTGSSASHTAGATVVDYVTSTAIGMISKGILVHADQDGTLKAGAVDVAAVLADNVVTTAKINNDAVTGAKSTVFPVTTDRQDIAANSTASDPHIQYGWTYVTGDAANLREAITITFPVAYDSAPVVIPGSVGYRTGSNPSTIGDLTSVAGGLGDFGWLVSVHSITTTTCVLEINKHVTAIPAATRLGLSWIAIGPKAR